jgi:hypothetical protein
MMQLYFTKIAATFAIGLTICFITLNLFQMVSLAIPVFFSLCLGYVLGGAWIYLFIWLETMKWAGFLTSLGAIEVVFSTNLS